MANFLNTDGLSALWAKIKSKFYTKTEVDAAIPDASSTSPLMDGTASIGSSTTYARADHVHPSDTSKANVADVLVKTNATSYTPTGNYNPATKKYVDDSIPSASTTTPSMDGTASYGSGTDYARANHVHPIDTSRAAVSDVLTKTNTTSYTPTANYNPATKKYVDDNVGVTSFNGNTGAITYTAPVTSVNSKTGAVVIDKIKTGSAQNSTEYQIMTTPENDNHSRPVFVYDEVMATIAKYAGNYARLTLGTSTTPGVARLYSNDKVNYYTDIKASTTSSNKTIVFPNADGTVALTSDILSNLSELSDTAISSPTDGQVLTYDSANSKWINEDVKNEVYDFTIFTNTSNMTVTYDEVYAAYQSGKAVYAINGAFLYHLCNANSYSMGFVGYYNNKITRYDWDKSTNSITRKEIEVIDTTISSPANGQILTYDSTTSKWINTTPSNGATYSLSMNNNVITLTGSDSSTSSATLPVFGGTSADVWEGGAY